MVSSPCAHRFTVTGGPGVVVLVRVLHTLETHLCRVGDGMTVGCNDHVIIPTRYGRDLARVVGPVSEETRGQYGETVGLHRVAVKEDIDRYRENQERAADAMVVCRELIDRHGLAMVLVTAHFVLDEPRLVFFFTAESRVDFRDLVKDLVHEFKLRIELRQIGVRDESRIVGGLGVCGRVLCCNGISDRLKAVSIKMAKVQGLSLNSMKISGPCGRLLCCLEYEYDFYREEKRGLPNVGGRVRHDGVSFRITEVNVLTGTIRLEGEGRMMTVPTGRVLQDPKTQRWRLDETGPDADGRAPEEVKPPSTGEPSPSTENRS